MQKEKWLTMYESASETINRVELQQSAMEFVDILGKDTMTLKAVEELAELQQAISKCVRMGNAFSKGIATQEEVDEAHRNLIEEMGDVIVQMGNLSYIFGVKDAEVLKAANVKINRGFELRDKHYMR